MYKALTTFTDLQDNNYKYFAGDEFPRKGLIVSDARIAELSSDKNRRHTPVIVEVLEEVKKEEVKEVKKSTSTKAHAKSKAPAKSNASGRKKTNAK